MTRNNKVNLEKPFTNSARTADGKVVKILTGIDYPYAVCFGKRKTPVMIDANGYDMLGNKIVANNDYDPNKRPTSGQRGFFTQYKEFREYVSGLERRISDLETSVY